MEDKQENDDFVPEAGIDDDQREERKNETGVSRNREREVDSDHVTRNREELEKGLGSGWGNFRLLTAALFQEGDGLRETAFDSFPALSVVQASIRDVSSQKLETCSLFRRLAQNGYALTSSSFSTGKPALTCSLCF